MDKYIKIALDLIELTPNHYVELCEKEWVVSPELDEVFLGLYGHYHIDQCSSSSVYVMINYKKHEYSTGSISYQYLLIISKIVPVYTEYFHYSIDLPDEDKIGLITSWESYPATKRTQLFTEKIKELLQPRYEWIEYHDLKKKHICLPDTLKSEYPDCLPTVNAYKLFFDDFLHLLPEEK